MAGDGAAEQGRRDGIGTGASQGKDLASAYVLHPCCRIVCPYLERGRQRECEKRQSSDCVFTLITS
jgi:hypothetical protein